MKVAITGPESSGKSALAIQLAAHYGTLYVPEFARFNLQETGPNYTREDVEDFILRQREWELAAEAFVARRKSGGCEQALLFTDTDAFVFKIWLQVRFNEDSPRTDEWIHNAPADLTLLCRPDLPWTYDPLREDQYNRDELFRCFRTEIEKYQLDSVIIDGSFNERLQKAIAAIDKRRKGR